MFKNYVGKNGYICEFCGGEFHNSKEDNSFKVNMHHLVNTRKIIDRIQDVNRKWNVVFVHNGCHSKIHNKLRGLKTNVKKEDWNRYVKKHNRAVKIMRRKLKELEGDSK